MDKFTLCDRLVCRPEQVTWEINLKRKWQQMATSALGSTCYAAMAISSKKQKNFLDFHVETQQFSSDDGGNDTASLSMTWEQCKYRLPTPNSTFHFKRSHFPPAPHNCRENSFSPPKLKTRNLTRSTFHSGGTFQHFVQKYSLLFFFWSKW